MNLSAGTIATRTALVLGLPVCSAKSSIDGINTGIVQSAEFILLDRALAHYGSDAKPEREQLQQTLVAGIEMVWPTEKTGIPALAAFERGNGMELVQDRLRELMSRNGTRRQTLAQARQLAGDLSQIRWLLIEPAHNPLPLPLLLILILWLTLPFASFGLLAPRNPTALTVLSEGAGAISAAIFLIPVLNQPLVGRIKVSSAPMRNALSQFGR